MALLLGGHISVFDVLGLGSRISLLSKHLLLMEVVIPGACDFATPVLLLGFCTGT